MSRLLQKTLGHSLQKLARYTTIANEGVTLTYLDGKNVGLAFHYVGVGRHLDRHQIEFSAIWLGSFMQTIGGRSAACLFALSSRIVVVLNIPGIVQVLWRRRQIYCRCG